MRVSLVCLLLVAVVACVIGAPNDNVGGFTVPGDLGSNFASATPVGPVLPQNYGLNPNYGSPLNTPALSQAQINNLIPTQQLQQQLQQRVAGFGVGAPMQAAAATPQIGGGAFGYPGAYGYANNPTIGAAPYGAGFGQAYNQPIVGGYGSPAAAYGQALGGGFAQPNTFGAGFGQPLGAAGVAQPFAAQTGYGASPYTNPLAQGMFNGLNLAQQGMNLLGGYGGQPAGLGGAQPGGFGQLGGIGAPGGFGIAGAPRPGPF